MTSTTTGSQPDAPTLTGGLDAQDPRHLFARAVALGGAAIAAVRPDQLDLPTPCEDFSVRQLLAHLTSVLPRVATLGRGGHVFDSPPTVEGVADDGWPTAWRSAAHEVQGVWSDATLLDHTFVLPWAELSGADLLAMYTSEVTVHTWDLATATGQQPLWDEEVLATSLAVVARILPADRHAAYEEAAARMPEDRRDFVPPFARPVPVPDTAPPIDRLVAWTGRRP
jgi:uncharacterized protein (TIGR03086 family)